jgi:hypothetical protein
LVTRLDVVVRQQLLLLVETLFLLLSKGLIRSAACAIWFAFSASKDFKGMQELLSGNVVDEIEVDVWDSVVDPSDAGDSDWHEEVKLDTARHLTKVVGVLRRLAPLMLEEVFVARKALGEIVAALLSTTGLVVGKGESLFDTWSQLLETGTFGATGFRCRKQEQNVHRAGATLGAL